MKKLNKNSTIGIIAPSGPFKADTLLNIEKGFNNLGYNVVFGESLKSQVRGYLSCDDETRINDIHNMFLDKNIDAIFCIRGGYGTLRIIDKIDFDIIKNNPKIFVGFSDITLLLNNFNKKSKLICFHGPMAGQINKLDELSFNSLFENINMNDDILIKDDLKVMNYGACRGELVGGNLSLLVASLGTEFEIDTKGKILFIEEINEYMYKIDKMITQLILCNKIQECNGIILGDFNNCKKSNEDDPSLYELLEERLKKFNKPIIYNLKSGHCSPNITLPIGRICEMNCDNLTIKFVK